MLKFQPTGIQTGANREKSFQFITHKYGHQEGSFSRDGDLAVTGKIF